jgi:hypothetical protein
MGLGEIRVAGGLPRVITDIGASEPIKLLKDIRKPTICYFLLALPVRKNVQATAIDLSQHFREVLSPLPLTP